MVPYVVRATIVHSESGDMEKEGSVGLDVHEGTGW